MNKTAMVLMYVMVLGAPLWAMPQQITFQGTLKQKGVPVNTTKNLQFSFVDASGSNIPGTAPISVANVQVTNGLFAVQLPIDPSIPWEQYSPFIQVSVEGQILSPNQPLNANMYAVAAIPQGLVAMFTASCPTGWTRFNTLDNAFPMGGAVYGATGGSATHTHAIATDGAHNHGGVTGGSTVNDNNQWLFGDPQGSGSHPNNFADAAHKHGISTDGAHNHGGATGSASSLPPYVTMVYCQKQ